ncbi:type II secretion system protein [Caldibacillus thermoamylovorans]|uniref:type II secretion system protein n=1 Tax=Caldibacillus thermoamylovorans TaxID=35841 RepID=UPI0022E79EB0|nr:type II secretion system protein [Caldibacillus thermoamylovorans]
MQKRMKLLKNQKGMTLVELLAVLVILGIIAAIAIPMIGNVINDSRDKAILADAQTVLSAAKVAYANGEGTINNSKTKITFNKDVLEPYVEGVTLADGDKVVYSVEKKRWSITYDDLKNMKKQKKYGLTTSDDSKVTTTTAEKLNKALQGTNNN